MNCLREKNEDTYHISYCKLDIGFKDVIEN